MVEKVFASWLLTLCVTLGNYLASLSCLNHCFL